MAHTSRPSQRPLAWYDAGPADALPFADYFADPSENPTVRPRPAEAARDWLPLEGEEGLLIVAPRRAAGGASTRPTG